MTRTTALAAFLPPLLAATCAHAVQPVDDFERGTFSFSSFVYEEHEVSIPAHSGHAMHATRTIILESDGGPVTATNTSSTPFPDRALTVHPSGDSSVRILWDWDGTRDLTVLGTVDRIEVVVGDSPPGGQITAILVDDGGGEGLTVPTTGGMEVLTFFLADWSTVDPANATTLGFRFGGGSDPYYVSEIRFRRSGSLNVDLVGDFVTTQVPPFPSPPLRFRVLDHVANPLYQADMVIQDAAGGGPVEMLATWETQSGATGDRGVTEFRWDESGVFSDSFLTLSVDLAPADGLVPELYPPDPVHDDPTSFFVEFPVRMIDDGTVVGVSNTLLLFDIADLQGAEFPSVLVTPRRSRRAWTTGFDLSFDLVGTSGVEVYEPLFHATWISDWEPASVVGVPEAASATPELLLAARPSVTRGTSVVSWTRPATTGARLSVHDLAGRVLRRSSVPPGSRSLRWDGRDSSGDMTPAGVYFLRLDDRSGTAVTRVTRLR